MVKKKQAEIPGFERPTIDEIDALCAEHQKTLERAKKAKVRAEAAKEAAQVCILKHLKKLETDMEGNHVYLYRDGDDELEYVIPCRGTMRTRKPKRTEERLEE